MPDEVQGQAIECLLKIKKGHVYKLVLLLVPLQQHTDGVDRIKCIKSTLTWTDGDNLPETGINCTLKYLHGMAEQADRAISVVFTEIAFAFPDRGCNAGSPE